MGGWCFLLLIGSFLGLLGVVGVVGGLFVGLVFPVLDWWIWDFWGFKSKLLYGVLTGLGDVLGRFY